MENTPTQPTTPVTTPTQPVASPQPVPTAQPSQPVQSAVTTQKSNLPLILGMLVLLFLVAGGAYYFGLQNGTQDQVAIVLPTPSSHDILEASPTGAPDTTQAPVSSDEAALNTYSHSVYYYSISYPKGWSATTEDYSTSAHPEANKVFIFNPADRPEENAFSGMIIEYVGMVQMDMSTAEKVVINGVDMFTSPSPHGTEYFVNIPDTDQFLKISGADGNTANEETNLGLRAAFATFQFVNQF